MPISATYDRLREIALTEFDDIVVRAEILRLPTADPLKLRLNLLDDSFLDVYISVTGRYSYHWERRHIDTGDMYRHDNCAGPRSCQPHPDAAPFPQSAATERFGW